MRAIHAEPASTNDRLSFALCPGSRSIFPAVPSDARISFIVQGHVRMKTGFFFASFESNFPLRGILIVDTP